MDTQGCSTPKHDTGLWSLHTRKCLLSGTLILVPSVVTLAMVAWLFNLIKQLLLPVEETFKMILSVGLVAPEALVLSPAKQSSVSSQPHYG